MIRSLRIEEVGISIITDAFAKGITFFDTSDVYGPKVNEILVGKALKKLPREEVQLATKFGVVKMEPGNLVVKGTPDYVRLCCEASLERLGVEYIDLYYVHQIDTLVPIEETMEELKKLVEEGKVKYVGLSEASPDTIRRAYAVHPITTLQLEWSLWTGDIEQESVPLCRELGIGIVPYSPLGRGFFGGKGPNSFLETHLPRFQAENLAKNKIFYTRIEKLAEKHDCTPTQLALAWVLHQGDDVVPIPGTTKTENLDNNIGSLRLKLTEDDLKEISGVTTIDEVTGSQINEHYARYSWKNANTPPRDGNFPVKTCSVSSVRHCFGSIAFMPVCDCGQKVSQNSLNIRQGNFKCLLCIQIM
ncbi:hypothetical protein BT93_H2995 [Corymbia citriodora subsp. variegata]|nr:hypothetical protein BT93_H2995 [Corymbia citriodora subsp. variegata]